MRLSTTTDAMSCLYGDEEAMRRLAAIGFDAVDFSLFVHTNDSELLSGPESGFLRHCEKVKRAADAAGISFGQVHAPMVVYPDTREKVDEYVRLSVRALKAAGIFDCPYVVVHPIARPDCLYDRGHKENKRDNLEFYPRLIDAARENRTKIAIENLFNWDPDARKICPTVCSAAEELADYVDTFNEIAGEERFAACLDTGHPTLVDIRPEDMVSVLGSRLQVLHVQDTNGINDLHTLPYYGGALKPSALCAALKEAGYSGTFSFEADGFVNSVPASCWEDAERMIHTVGRTLIARITD